MPFSGYGLPSRMAVVQPVGLLRSCGRVIGARRCSGASAFSGTGMDMFMKPPPLRPQLPVMAARNMNTRLHCTEFVCWLSPRLPKIMQPSALAISSARRRMSCASIPVIGAAHSGV